MGILHGRRSRRRDYQNLANLPPWKLRCHILHARSHGVAVCQPNRHCYYALRAEFYIFGQLGASKFHPPSDKGTGMDQKYKELLEEQAPRQAAQTDEL